MTHTIDDTIRPDRIFVAIGGCIMAHFLFAIMGACAKYLSATHHVAEIAFYRNLVVLIPVFLFIMLGKKTHLLRTNKPKLVAVRAIIGGFSLIVTFAALSKLPMAYATVTFFTSSILTPVLAFLFLKEHVGIHRWAAVFVGMCGVLIIAQPSGAVSMWGLSFALMAACFHASMFTVLRGLKTESPMTITFYFILAGVLIPGMFMPWVYSPIAYEEIWVFLLIGVSGGTAQIFLANAYKYAPAAVVTPFSYSALLWTTMLDLYMWHYDLDLVAVFSGAALILSAQLYIVYREYVNKHRVKTAH